MLQSYRQIWDLLTRRERLRFVLLVFLTILMSVFELVSVASILPFLTVIAQPELLETNWALQAFARLFGLEGGQEVIIGLGILVCVLVIVGMIVRALVTYAQIRFALARSYTLASRLLHTYLAHDYVWYLSRNTAALSQSLLSEIDQVVRESILPGVLTISNLTTLVLIGGFLFFIQPAVALGAIGLLLGVYLVAFLLLRNRIARLGKLRMAANKERFQVVQEVAGGLKEIKTLGLERSSLMRFRTPAVTLAGYQATGQVYARLPRFALEAMVYAGFVGMVVVMVVLRDGDVADLLPVLGLLAMSATKLFPALQQLYQQGSQIRFSAAALDRLHREMQDTADHPAPALAAHEAPPLPLREEIRFSDVHFRYPQGEQPTLQGLNLRIGARSSVGIVGGTGAGKTTVIDLLLGLLHPDKGELLIDGVALDRDRIRAWQRNIGYVPQAIFLTDDTIANNIAFGLSAGEVDRARVEEVARIANLHDFILSDLPQGYDTLVGERGLRLSGGQRQRIGIARALYRDPEVLVLDEATSALDNLTERAVMEAMKNIGHSKTVIMIAHRLTTVRDCDNIFLLERGELIAEGSYDELAATNDTFRRMVGE